LNNAGDKTARGSPSGVYLTQSSYVVFVLAFTKVSKMMAGCNCELYTT